MYDNPLFADFETAMEATFGGDWNEIDEHLLEEELISDAEYHELTREACEYEPCDEEGFLDTWYDEYPDFE